MKLHLQSDSGVTLVANTFIDQYMSAANGEFVKLYIYLLRCAGSGVLLTVSSIADFFDHTEKDVLRGLSYWEKQGLLRISRAEDGEITDVEILDTFSHPQADAQAVPEKSAPAAIRIRNSQTVSEISGDIPIPDKKNLSSARLKELRSQDDIRQLIFVAETYLGRTLSPTEIRNLCYFYDGLGFSSDLIEYLIEYCAAKGSPGARYMEKVALGWYKAGITTVADAKKESALFHKDYYTIFSALGIRGRAPIEAEIQYMDRWTKEWGFDMDVVVEACSRTILQTHEPSFSYTEGILKRWMEKNIHTLNDVHEADKDHSRQKKQAADSAPARASSSRGGTRFTNFPQRSIDMTSLEAKLLDAQSHA